MNQLKDIPKLFERLTSHDSGIGRITDPVFIEKLLEMRKQLNGYPDLFERMVSGNAVSHVEKDAFFGKLLSGLDEFPNLVCHLAKKGSVSCICDTERFRDIVLHLQNEDYGEFVATCLHYRETVANWDNLKGCDFFKMYHKELSNHPRGLHNLICRFNKKNRLKDDEINAVINKWDEKTQSEKFFIMKVFSA